MEPRRHCGYLHSPQPNCSTQVDLLADQGYLVEIGLASDCVVTEENRQPEAKLPKGW